MDAPQKSFMDAVMEANRRSTANSGSFLRETIEDPRVSILVALVNDLRARVDELEDDFPENDIGGGDLGDTYRSYFRVLIDSDGMIAVTDGADSATEESKCGAVKVNGQRVEVLADFFAPGTSTTHCIWLHSWIDSDGVAHAEIIDGDTIPPDNPNAGIGHGSQLLARVAVDEHGVATITQDYLRGGEHLEIIAGDCNGGAIAEAE